MVNVIDAPTDAPDSSDERNVALTAPTMMAAPDPNLAMMLPKSGSDLMALAKQISASGLFDPPGQRLSPQQAFAIMLEGAYYGVTPFTALKHITLIKGKPTPSALLVAGIINRDRRIRRWEVDADNRHCTITVERSDRPGVVVETVRIEDVPPHLTKPSRSGEPSNYTKHPGDMLYAWCVRRIAKRHLPDIVTGLSVVEHDPRNIVDVEAVQATTGPITEVCSECGGPMKLLPSSTGGTFLACEKCRKSAPPPPQVRNLLRNKQADRERQRAEALEATKAWVPPEWDEEEQPDEETPEPPEEPTLPLDEAERRADAAVTRKVGHSAPPPAVPADPEPTATDRLRREVAMTLAGLPVASRNRFLEAWGAPGGDDRRPWLRQRQEDELIALRDALSSLAEQQRS